jgi:transposase
MDAVEYQSRAIDICAGCSLPVPCGTKHLWLTRIMERQPIKAAAVARANKIARMAWAMMVRGERFREPRSLLAA